MVQTVTTKLAGPIARLELINGRGRGATNTQSQTEKLKQLCAALGKVTEQVKNFQQTVLSEYKRQTAQLSVKIAEKILMQKIDQGDYKIEPIIEQALNDAPAQQNITVHLNPDDLAQYQKNSDKDGGKTLNGVEFVADSNIGRAECALETPKGFIELSIEENLERIAKAFEKIE